MSLGLKSRQSNPIIIATTTTIDYELYTVLEIHELIKSSKLGELVGHFTHDNHEGKVSTSLTLRLSTSYLTNSSVSITHRLHSKFGSVKPRIRT